MCVRVCGTYKCTYYLYYIFAIVLTITLNKIDLQTQSVIPSQSELMIDRRYDNSQTSSDA